MGISENAAVRSLYFTGNASADHAASWVFENIDNPELHSPFVPPLVATLPDKPDLKQSQQEMEESRALKMVFVVNSELKMGTGKVAAQVGHATLALYKTLLINTFDHLVRDWENQGAKKIVLKGTNAQQLLILESIAKSKQVSSVIVKDAGKTQVAPGSITVLALFGKGYQIDEITGKLPLL